MPIQPGVKLGAYEVQDYVGRGAMGVVFRAYHEGLARMGAVKVLQVLAPDPDASARFRREAQAIAQMRHPNILNVFDFGEYEGVPYMIVELVPGGSLQERMRRGPTLRHETVVKLLRGIASALDYAHGLGVVHRDVKPANVLLGKDENPILADFGLAKLLAAASVKTMSGATTGTPAYMAPEQVVGGAIGPAADRYALTTMAFEMLTGTVPFEGDNVLELLYAHVHRQPPPASSRNKELGAGTDAVLERGLAKDPEKRWETSAALVDALEETLKPAPEPASLLPPEPMPAIAATMVPPAARKRRRPRLLVAVAAALVLALLLAAAAFVRTRGGPIEGSLSSRTVQAGSTVVVSAHNLPANQAGLIRLLTPGRDVGTFRADKQGEVEQGIAIPRDEPAGDHVVQLCWSGSCHDLTTVHVTR
jgi:eukaryotic-like serine/threonine-protein kinase